MTRTDSPESSEGFDVIGDVHGMGSALEELLLALGYSNTSGVWRHPTRRVAFIGDLIDRGPEQALVLEIAKAMCDAGTAEIVMGNHEFNAIAFATPHPTKPGEFLRPHTPHNERTHQAFLDLPQADRDRAVAWFQTMPLWLELDGLRLVHACWDQPTIAALAQDQRPCGDPAFMARAAVKPAAGESSAEFDAIELLLKGPELPVPRPYLDKGGKARNRARLRWWDPHATTLATAALIPGGTTGPDGEAYGELPDDPVESPVAPYTGEVPVLFGHYWEGGTPAIFSAKTACVDYSACKGNKLVAYRWSGEADLRDDHFTWVNT